METRREDLICVKEAKFKERSVSEKLYDEGKLIRRFNDNFERKYAV